MEVPQNLSYTKEHEWLRDEGAGVVTVGITDYAQNSLGDVTFVDLPKVGAKFEAGRTFGVVESVKAASDLYMPVTGEVVAINDTVVRSPELVNRAPYGDAWMVKVRLADPAQLGGLLTPEAYSKLTG